MNSDWLDATVLYTSLFASIALSSIAQIFQKLAARGGNSDKCWFVLSLLCLGVALMLWLVVLSVMPVSQAYPMLSLSYVLVMLLARWLFKERIPWQRWVGAGFIMLGISVLMGSA